MLVSYNWLKDYLGENLPSVDKVIDLLTLHSFEVESKTVFGNDVVIDIKVLPDRASDCLSQRGVAREIATLIDKELVKDPLKNEVNLPLSENFKITIADDKACTRFMVAHISGVKIAPSPQWLIERLAVIGQKSINNVVDATNYVMHAIGQPMHAYDADLFKKTSDNKWHFLIRHAESGETVSLLKDKNSEEERKVVLENSELLIVDGESNLPIGLAGVKGGDYASVNDDTRNIIIESAHFSASVVRRTARKHSILTDAVKRFENNPAEELPGSAIIMIVDLIKEIASGHLEGVHDEYPNKKTAEDKVLVRLEKINQILGLELNEDTVISILKRLGAKIDRTNNGLLVTTPVERTDLLLEVNYVEEIGRIYGLDNIKSIKPQFMSVSEINTAYYYCQKIRHILLEQGLSEIMTSSFRKKDQIQLLNSLASDKGFIRSSILPALDQALMQNIQNVDILGLKDIRVFEIGKVFQKKEGEINEKLVLALGVQTKKTGHTPADDKILNSILETLHEVGVTGAVVNKGVCEIELDELLAKLPKPTNYEKVSEANAVSYKSFSLYPAIVRDIAMWVGDDIKKDEILTLLKEESGSLCVKITLFDEFAKAGRISYAFRLVFQSMDKTLTDEEVDVVMQRIYQIVKERGFETR